jgi:hypothetical protein
MMMIHVLIPARETTTLPATCCGSNSFEVHIFWLITNEVFIFKRIFIPGSTRGLDIFCGPEILDQL